MKLREALEIASSGGSVTPRAINGDSYVYYDEESHSTSNRPWQYIPDIELKKSDVYSLADDQLERVVLFAHSQEWEPTSNPIIEELRLRHDQYDTIIKEKGFMETQEQEQIKKALAELTQQRGYRDATGLVRAFYLATGGGYDYLCTLQAPDGSAVYCRTPRKLFTVLEAARVKNETNEGRTAAEPRDSPPWTLVGNFDLEEDGGE